MKRTSTLEVEFDNKSKEIIANKLSRIQYPDTKFQSYVSKFHALHKDDDDLKKLLAPIASF